MKKNQIVGRMMCVVVVVLLTYNVAFSRQMPTGNVYVNSIGMKLVRIEPGCFAMGFGDKTLPEDLIGGNEQFPNGDFDEHPTHTVKISMLFHMGVYEVTNAQYELFDPAHKKQREGSPAKDDDDAVINVNWYDAYAFCKWLSDQEGLPYRLPTEAEWEYACRAGTTTPFCTGNTPPEPFSKESRGSLTVGESRPNAWGLYDMHGNVEEWCHDWYGPYETDTQSDPVGRATGDFRVSRGGSHSTDAYYLRSSNRLGTVPEDKHALIGFRVVIGYMPTTQPLPKPGPQLYQTNVKQEIPAQAGRVDPAKPYFQGPRKFVHMPPGNRGPLFFKHNHFTSVVECPNGDLLAIWHTCVGESGRELAVAVSRLRYGQDQWEPASLFWDAPDRNDHGHALWFDGKDTIYHFIGLAIQIRNVALVMRTSKDSGVTWSAPRMIVGHGPSRMPVESVFRTREGLYMISCDKGPNVLWISPDEGISWYKSKGSIRGKHACAVQLTDGRLLGLGRERNIDGKMPTSISDDLGDTWQYFASEFQPVCWGQRAVLLRLEEGPLLFASFCKKLMIKNASGKQYPVTGLFGAVSFDEGKSWSCKRLITDDAPGREIGTINDDRVVMDAYNSEVVGYLTVCQSADGLIHLLTSRQHYSFNLKWLTTLPPAPSHPLSSPEAQKLPAKRSLPNVFRPKESSSSAQGRLSISTEGHRGFYWRSDGAELFTSVDQKKGFAAEIKAQVHTCLHNERGVDVELYDGAGSRYAMTVTDTGVYWYEGLIVGSALLPFDQFTPIVQGLNNTDTMHTYRLAVRRDRIAQIYRDGKLLGVRRYEYRTPREPYIQVGAGSGLKASVEYVSYDLGGPSQPKE